jgi:cyclopropane-fatty-acyl-phospholipid synthase
VNQSNAWRKPSAWQALHRGLLRRAFSSLRGAYLEIRDAHQALQLGERRANLRAEVDVHDPSMYPETVLGGSIGAGRSYMQGKWDADDLTKVVRILARQGEVLARWRRGPARLLAPLYDLAVWTRRNTVSGSRRNIREHYDLSNEFFATFLDPTLMYSCAYFERNDATLEEASLAKLDLICRKLQLSPSDHLLEIGTGWGGLAVHAARHYGCRVTTTTISAEQARHARQRVKEAGLDDRVTVITEDYRRLTGRYDKLVSVEMIEAVGSQYFDTFFAKCSSLLTSGGSMLLQAITIADGEYQRAARSVDFIKRYIFPGSCLPSMQRMREAVRNVTDLMVADVHDITAHYATTLRHWHRRLRANERRIHQLGFDETFLRMWEFYLCYCEGGFHERRIGDVQLLLTKPGARPSLAQPTR